MDFDGTIVQHKFPHIGKAVPECFDTLREFQHKGIKLILWTMRSNNRSDGTNPLSDAVEFCKSNGIEFWSVNSNPEQSTWTGSPKCYANLYIDDAAVGCPLIDFENSLVVDWLTVKQYVLGKI